MLYLKSHVTLTLENFIKDPFTEIFGAKYFQNTYSEVFVNSVETYLGPFQTSMMQFFCENMWQLLALQVKYFVIMKIGSRRFASF